MAIRPTNREEHVPGFKLLYDDDVLVYRMPWRGRMPVDFTAAVAAIDARLDALDARQAEHDAKLDALTASVADLASRLPEGPNVFVISSAPPGV